MSGSDMVAMYKPLLEMIHQAIRKAEEAWTSIGKPVPTEAELESFFFFLLSRMSHLRMIPLADLANAALPGEANARIVAQEDGCGILAKGKVRLFGPAVCAQGREVRPLCEFALSTTPAVG